MSQTDESGTGGIKRTGLGQSKDRQGFRLKPRNRVRTVFLLQTLEASRDQVSRVQWVQTGNGPGQPGSGFLSIPSSTIASCDCLPPLVASRPFAGSTCVLNKQRPSWKRRILGCFLH